MFSKKRKIEINENAPSAKPDFTPLQSYQQTLLVDEINKYSLSLERQQHLEAALATIQKEIDLLKIQNEKSKKFIDDLEYREDAEMQQLIQKIAPDIWVQCRIDLLGFAGRSLHIEFKSAEKLNTAGTELHKILAMSCQKYTLEKGYSDHEFQTDVYFEVFSRRESVLKALEELVVKKESQHQLSPAL